MSEEHCDRILDKDFAKGFVDTSNAPAFKVWDFETALFGDPYKKIPSMASSSGYVGWFFPDKKTALVDFDKKTYHPKLKERTLQILAHAKKKPIETVSQQFKKDELLDEAKVLDPQCRNINGHDFAMNIAYRMYTGEYHQYIIDHPEFTFSAIGLNPHSHQWERLMQKAHQHPNHIAGDLSKQEATTNIMFAQGYAVHVSSNYNFDEDQAATFSNLMKSLDSYTFIFNGSAYSTIRGHSSGHFETANYNSYMVWAAHKLIFEKVCGDSTEFEDHVKLVVLGDDSEGSVTDEVAPLYNMTVLSKQFKECFGMKYTSPSKGAGVSEDFIVRDEDKVFLGRTPIIVNGPNHGKYMVGRLRFCAILDQLVYGVDVPSLTRKEAIQIRADSAFAEMSLYSRKQYNSIKNEYIDAMNLRAPGLMPVILSHAENRKKVLSNWYLNDNTRFENGGVMKKVY